MFQYCDDVSDFVHEVELTLIDQIVELSLTQLNLRSERMLRL